MGEASRVRREEDIRDMLTHVEVVVVTEAAAVEVAVVVTAVEEEAIATQAVATRSVVPDAARCTNVFIG